jgi:hypothetical protein
MTATAETAAHLQYVIDSWDHLTDMLTTRHGSTWPPAMGITHVLDGTADPDTAADEAAARADARLAERADSGYTLGESPAPIRLLVVDVMRAVETALVYETDVLAQEVQRPVMAAAPSHWLPADREMRARLVAEDSADPRRWRYGQHRTAVYAAVWLLCRIERRPGPFLALSGVQQQRLARVARTAHDRIAQVLDAVRTAQLTAWPCPLCDSPIGMSSGDGAAPVAVCFGCRQEWTLATAEVA